jgi:ADP-heptose:LPS heptosyltransferase
MSNQSSRVLCYHFAGIGDIISSLHVVKALHEKGYQVFMTSFPEVLELLETQSFVTPLPLEQASAQKFDLLIDLESSSKSAKDIRKLRAKKKIGLYANFSKRLKNMFLYQMQLPKHSTGHIIRDYDVFLKALSLRPLVQPELEIAQLKSSDTKKSTAKKIGIHATARNQLRVLPEDLMIQFCKLAIKNGCEIIFFGSEDDIIEEWISQISGPAHHFKGRLKQTAMKLLELDSFIGTDSGILHMNTALGKKSIGVFGPKRSEQICPSQRLVTILEKDYPCRPCNQNKPCPYGKRCLTWLSAERLWHEVDHI